MFVLDTNTLIYFFKGLGHVEQNLFQASPQEVALPAVSLYELEVGIAKSSAPSRRRRQLQELKRWITILPFAEAEARTSALLRAELEQAGTPIGPLDCLIAGTALSHGGTLVTRNLREFGRIRRLSLVDWYEER